MRKKKKLKNRNSQLNKRRQKEKFLKLRGTRQRKKKNENRDGKIDKSRDRKANLKMRGEKNL